MSFASAPATGRRWPGSGEGPSIIEKYGGLNNASAYIGLMPSRKLGIVILGNRGNQYPNETGRRILFELAAVGE
jgi:beta-lactamase class C